MIRTRGKKSVKAENFCFTSLQNHSLVDLSLIWSNKQPPFGARQKKLLCAALEQKDIKQHPFLSLFLSMHSLRAHTQCVAGSEEKQHVLR